MPYREFSIPYCIYIFLFTSLFLFLYSSKFWKKPFFCNKHFYIHVLHMHTCIINLCFKCAVSSFYMYIFYFRTLKAEKKKNKKMKQIGSREIHVKFQLYFIFRRRHHHVNVKIYSKYKRIFELNC